MKKNTSTELSISLAAELLNTSRPTLYKWLAEGKIADLSVAEIRRVILAESFLHSVSLVNHNIKTKGLEAVVEILEVTPKPTWFTIGDTFYEEIHAKPNPKVEVSSSPEKNWLDELADQKEESTNWE